MTRWRWGPLAGSCLGLVLVARGTLAKPADEESAEAHIRRGLELRRSGEDVSALAEFERAEALVPSTRARAQIGFALQALGRWREAEEAQLHVLADTSDPWVREHGDLVREALAAVQHHLSWLTVDCNVLRAELAVNGTTAGALPLPRPVRVVSGVNVLEVRADGYDPVRRTVDVPAGFQVRESVTMLPSLAATPRALATTMPSVEAGGARRTAGWVTISGGALLVCGGAALAGISAVYTARYNQDSRCFVGGLSRDQNCGVDRGIAETSLATAAAAIGLGGLAISVGALLVATSPRPSAVSAASLECRIAPVSIGCQGRF